VVHVPGARRVALSGDRDGALHLWDLDRGDVRQTLTPPGARVTCVALEWPSRRALSGGDDGPLRLWDLEQGAVTRVMKGHEVEVACLAADWGEQRAISGALDGRLRLWDLDSGASLLELQCFDDSAVLCVDLHVATGRAVSGGADRTLRSWDLDTGEVLLEFPGHQMPVNCVAVNFEAKPDVVAVSGSFAICRFWALTRFPFFWDFSGHAGAVTCLAIHWPTLTILSGSADSTLQLGHLGLNSNRIEQRKVLRGHEAEVTSLAVDWERRRAVSGGADGAVRFWDLERCTTLQELRHGGAGVLCVALALDGFDAAQTDEGAAEIVAAGAVELSRARAKTGVSAEAASLPDLALKRFAQASSNKSWERAAAFAVDGNPGTRWTSEYSDNQWLLVDLGQVQTLSRVEIRWEAAYATSYVLHGSTDGDTWRTMATEVGREGWVVTRLPPKTSARWIRVYGQKRATNFGFSIWEFKVYGPEP